jgi:cytochrome c oxidase assembly protein subunit 15
MNETPVRATPDEVGEAAYQPWLHRYLLLLAAATLLLITAGGLVTSHDAGLAVPDWPTSYGYNMFTFPPSQWVGGIFYEHTHRLLGSLVGMLTIGLVILLWRLEKRRWVCILGCVALAAVIVQGVLGGITVLFLLPTPVSVMHACLAQTFFCIVVGLAVFTSNGWHQRVAWPRLWAAMHAGGSRSVYDVRLAAAACVAVIFLQLLAGAVMRHTKSGLAVPDFPLAYGQIIPSLSEAAVIGYNLDRRFDLFLPQVEARQIVYHMLHRFGAVLATLVIFATTGLALLRYRGASWLLTPAACLVGLVIMQWLLGAATVLTQKSPLVATAHVAFGALTLATSVVLLLRAAGMRSLLDERKSAQLPSIPAMAT